MTIAPSLTLTLTQTKRFTGVAPRTDRLAVQNVVVPSLVTTASLEAAFIVGPATGVDRERLIRMLSLTVPADVALPINPLTFFSDAVVDVSLTAIVGDTLRIALPPGEWDPTGFLPATLDFIIAAVVPGRIELVGPFLWSAADLTFTIYAPNLVTVRVAGTAGRTEREDLVPLEWRCDRFTGGFESSDLAHDHLAYVQGYVAALAVQAEQDVQEFLDADGGNPIVNTY